MNEYKSLIDKSVAQYRAVRSEIKQEELALKEAEQKEQDCLEVQKIIQEVAEKVQRQAHVQIAEVVTRCLNAVFDDPYEFKIDFAKKRGKTEAQLKFTRNGQEIDPIDGAGGGVLDVASFALRLACVLMHRPKLRNIMILDEPFRFVSKLGHYRERIRALLETLSVEMDMQFLIVTHDPELQIGKVIEIR